MRSRRLQVTTPLPEGDFCTPLRWIRKAEQFPGVAEIAARVTASADPLSLAEAARLELTRTERGGGAVRREMTAPDGDCSLTFKGSAFHSAAILPKSLHVARYDARPKLARALEAVVVIAL